MLRRSSFAVTTKSSPLLFSSSLLTTGATRSAHHVGHFRDHKQKHPLQDVIPGVRRAAESETVTTADGRTLVYEYPVQHEIWSEEECRAVRQDSRPRRSFLDSSAYWAIQFIRLSFDIASGYMFGKLTKAKILRRVLFLECAAGIPGAVAGTLRHLKSLRTMQRDRGWIQTLLQEAENERMHMLVALHMYNVVGKPGIIMRTSVIVVQFFLWNIFFSLYLLTGGKWCHRFVGYLEESAVYTYTHIIEAMESTDPQHKELNDWGKEPAPEIAIKYWKLKDDAKILDVFLQILADEDNHKKVNHCFADLKADQVNPYISHDEVHRCLREQIEQQKQEKMMKEQASSSSSTPVKKTVDVEDENEQPEGKILTKKVGARSSSSSSSSSAPNKGDLFSKSVSSIDVGKI